MKPLIKKFFLLTISFLLFLNLSAPIIVLASENSHTQIVKVAFAQSPGLSETHEDGTRSGVFYDWLIEIAKYTKWEYEFIEGNVSELMDMMDDGKIDIMSGMFHYPQLEEIYFYPHYSIGFSSSMLLKRNDDNSIQSFDVSTLNHKTIGVFSNNVKKIEQLKYFLSFNSLSCELRYFADSDKLDNALDAGEIDLLLGSDSYYSASRTVAATLGGSAMYIVARKDLTKISQQLDEAITNIYMTNPHFATELYDKYFPQIYNYGLFLTDENLEFINNSPPIRVALMKNRYPLSYVRKNEHQGVCQDTFDLISQQTGLNFEYIYAETYQDMINLVSSGKADIVGSFMDSENAAQNIDMVLTKSYAEFEQVILKNKKSVYPSDDLIFSLVEGHEIPQGIKAKTVLTFHNPEECINAVEKGNADIVCLPFAFVEDLFYHNYYTQVAIIAANTNNTNVSIAMLKSVDIQLFSILNKAINSLTSGEMESIISHNLMSMSETTVSLKSLLYSNPLAFIFLSVVFFFLLFLIILLYIRFKMKNQLITMKLQKAEESTQTKSEFLSQMSHEIRTPMNAIIGLTQIALRSEDISPQVAEQLEEIESSSQFLLSLVNDILDISKIENSKMQLNITPCRPRLLMEQAESLMRVKAEEKNITVEFNCDLQNEWFEGDILRIKQVIINLLSNALKFTQPNGKIILSLSEIERNNSQAQLRFSVKDNGIGIEKQDLELIFRSFEQSSVAKKIGKGTGLGLAISSNLVELMGGKLCVESTYGDGSEFFFHIWLPFSNCIEENEEKTPQVSHHKLDGMRILLAEDNDLNAKIVVFMLEAEGVTVERAIDGQTVIDMFASHPANYYNLILMDIQMPVKSGFAATSEIRNLNHQDAKTIPIIAMTANTFKEDEDKAIEAGMNGFLSKPFQIQNLYDVIEEGIQNENQTEE